MQFEDYLEIDHPNGIRIRSTRVNLEDVVYAARQGQTPARIVQSFPSLSLEQVHAALTYYYHNQQQLDAYIQRQEAGYESDKQRHEAGERPEIVGRLLQHGLAGPT
jgi:uncharacterized protein (DUF433 family)